MLTLGSLFDGIGTWQLSAVKAGIKPVWSSEIEKFPMEISKRHFPDTIQLGDITKINGAEIPPVDIICAGSPCQDLSIAGKQAGLAGERSGLFMEAIRICREMRDKTNGEYPKYFVWENVPGAFSSNNKQDFKAVLEEITETSIPMPKSGRWSNAGLVRSKRCELAWRVLDAQYWGVPQRRKRIFLVADFRNTFRCAGEILLVEQSVSRNIEKGKGERKDTSRKIESCTRETSTGVNYGIYTTMRPENTRVYKEKATALINGTCLGHQNGVVVGTDVYNHQLSGDKAVTFTAASGSSPTHSGPTVIEGFDSYNHVSTGNKVPTINSDYQKANGARVVSSECYRSSGFQEWVKDENTGTLTFSSGDKNLINAEYWKDEQSQTVDTLTAHNAGGSQRMPDKDHFNGVIEHGL